MDTEFTNLRQALRELKITKEQAVAALRPLMAFALGASEAPRRMNVSDLETGVARLSTEDDWRVVFPEIAQLHVSSEGDGIRVGVRVVKRWWSFTRERPAIDCGSESSRMTEMEPDTKRGFTMTFYLKDKSCDKQRLARFKSALAAFGGTLEASEVTDGKLIRLMASSSPIHKERIEVTCSQEKSANVEDVCRHFGFEVSKESPHKSEPAKIGMDV